MQVDGVINQTHSREAGGVVQSSSTKLGGGGIGRRDIYLQQGAYAKVL